MADLMKSKMREYWLNPPQETVTERARYSAWRIKRGVMSLASKRDQRASNKARQRLALVGRTSGMQLFQSPCLVGTFHKTGTRLMRLVFEDLASNTNSSFWNIGLGSSENDDWDVGFDFWSDFSEHGIDSSRYPTAVIIRDPRDVIVSSMKYHSRDAEPWLLVPQETLGGKTYQEALLELETDEDRYHFELKHQAGATIAEMLAAKRDPLHSSTLFMPLERLMGDTSLGGYKELFEHLGLVDAYLPLALVIAFDNSVFNPKFSGSKHITSGRPAVWRSVLPQSVLDELENLYPASAAELGYLT